MNKPISELSKSFSFLPATALMCALLVGANLAVAATEPKVDKNRLWLKTNYVEFAEEGIYELEYNPRLHLVFGAVIDRVRREQNLGYVYAFDADTLQVKGRYAMPYRAFSLAQDRDGKWLYVGHTQAASLRISKMSPDDGKLLTTSERLHVEPAEPENEHLRHMAYNDLTHELFVSYIGSVGKGEERKSNFKLLVLDGETLQMRGEVENAFSAPGFGFYLDKKTQRIYTSGNYINEIDPVSKKLVRTLDLKDAQPKVNNLLGLAVDHDSERIFATQFTHKRDDEHKAEHDGLYVFDLRTGEQIKFVHTGVGSIAVEYNPKRNEVYVSNFKSGTVSVVDGKTYEITKQIPVTVFPNMMTQTRNSSTLYVGLKQGFNKNWNPDEFVEGAKEQILSISLDEDAPSESKP